MNIKDLRQSLGQFLKRHRKQIVALIVIVVIIVSAAFLVSQIWQPPSEEVSSLKIIQYKIEPTEFKVTENATLFLEVRNKMENSTIKCDYHFETHNGNVKLYLGDDLLPKLGDNYTHTKFLDPKEKSSLEFTVVASLDIGDDFRGYYIKVYIYVDDVFVGVGDVDFRVKRN